MKASLTDGQSLAFSLQGVRGRKVRSPQGNMPANGRGDSLKAGFTESATENIPPSGLPGGKGEKVRQERTAAPVTDAGRANPMRSKTK